MLLTPISLSGTFESARLLPYTPRNHRSLSMRCLAMLSLLAIFSGRSAAEFPAVKDLPVQAGLPDPLVMLDGAKVTTKQQWVEKRRPELKALFQHYMYGNFPPPCPSRRRSRMKIRKRSAARRPCVRSHSRPSGTRPFRLLVVIPNNRKGRPQFRGAELQRQPHADGRSEDRGPHGVDVPGSKDQGKARRRE